ncbi:RNA polymerase I-specific transcription initiation factor RRN3 [Sporodiniella umbellata]|nr:RNA polymerase I-specific transcription initiation factor RRN3 [Sporodiniella umbellata]
MPVRSPTIVNAALPQDLIPQEAAKANTIPVEETNENVSKEKMNNLKLVMKTFIMGALRGKEQGNSSRYNELIETLNRDPSSPDAPSTLKLYTWVIVLSQSVSQLDKSCASLVESALGIDWSFRNRGFVDAYIDFLENLVSAHAFYAVPVLNVITQGFRFRNQLPENTNITRTQSYERHHEALQCILRLIPTAANSLFVSLVRHMPHKRFNSAEQAAYVKNIFLVSEYTPVLRKQILGLVIDQMVQIDAQIQIELDEMQEDVDVETYNMNFDADYNSEQSENEEDEDDDVSDDESVASLGSGKEEKKDTTAEIKYKIRKLDAMMSLTFQYFQKCAQTTPAALHEMFYALVDIFDRAVLKTLKSRYTQFLLFYFCSLNVIEYSDHFLDHLVHHITDPLKPNVTRVAASAYISSYVARAKFIDSNTTQRVILSLSAWCDSYMDTHEASVITLDCSKHDVFYAVIQATMYIFCFKWRDLVIESELDMDEDLEDDMYSEEHRHLTRPEHGFSNGITRTWCLGLRNLPRLMMSRFNPLKICAPAVVRQFARLARSTHFMYVYPIIEKNREIFVPGLGSSNLLQAVQTFFPFDPYKLDGSKVFIDNIYFEWIAEDESDDSSDDSSEEEDEDDDDDSVTSGMMAMSISPM